MIQPIRSPSPKLDLNLTGLPNQVSPIVHIHVHNLPDSKPRLVLGNNPKNLSSGFSQKLQKTILIVAVIAFGIIAIFTPYLQFQEFMIFAFTANMVVQLLKPSSQRDSIVKAELKLGGNGISYNPFSNPVKSS